ncbi:MAG: NAD(P)-dependent alcohol dehydrogenase [Actinobacteria bacterium]|nr:NAD(P)-dependent alcohol dehydrogenase [Actinomycetota bacterium]
MKAAVRTRYGPPEVVQLEEVDRPTAGDDELLIKVGATTVNRTDCGYRAGAPFLIRFFSGLRHPKVAILGTEFAGEVVAVGTDVTSYRLGDRVCGYCEGTFGAHAEYMTIQAERLIARIPTDSTFEEAAPSTEGSHYALGMLRSAEVRNGHDVLIYGATGAIGSAAVQIAKSLGATVTAVCGTAHVAQVESLGADRVIDYQTTDFTQDEQRYDLVIDAVGKSSFRRCRRLLKPRGIYISSDVGILWHGPILALITPLFRGRKLMFIVPRRDPEGITYLKRLIESGEFKPVIDRRYPLDQIVDAYQYVETGQKIGNVVITV